MVVDDLRRLPPSPLIVAEGSPITPDLVASGIADPFRAVWLIPTADFQRARLAERDLPPGPHQLYLLLATVIERQAAEHAVPTLTLDGSQGIDETVAAVEERFAEALAAGPWAESPAERRALLHEANTAIVEQVRGYYARTWADGDASLVMRTFVCECGATACDASVQLAVGAASAEPVLAPGHG